MSSKPIRLLFGLLLPMLAAAQNPIGYLRSGFEGQQWWDGNRLFTTNSPVVTEERPGQKARSHKPPGFFRQVVKGVAYATQKVQGEVPKLWICRTTDLEHWEKLVYFENPGFKVLDLCPLENGRYLVLSGFWPWIKDGKAAPWAIWKPNETGKLELASLENGGLDLYDVRRVPAKEPGEPPAEVAEPKPGMESAAMELGLTFFTQVEGGVAVVWVSQGKVLVFSGEDGRWRRTGTLFPSMEDSAHAKKPKPLVFLGSRPTQNGHLLLASRSEDAVLHAQAFFPAPAPLGADDRDPKDDETAHNKELEAFPEIFWWDFDPVTAHFVRQNPPPAGMPDKILKASIFESFNFWMNVKDQPILSR